MGISEKTLKLLWGKSGGKCAFPGCNEDLFSEGGVIIGDCCHIIAQSENGSRGKEKTDEESIHKEDNLILLCRNHHKLVDDFPEKYTSDILKQYKRQHEEQIRQRLDRGKHWNVNFSQIYYMNVPRIGAFAALQGIYFDNDMGNNSCLHNMGFELNYLMSKVQHLIEVLQIHAGELKENGEPFMVGQFVSINGKFYTKNVPVVNEVCAEQYFATGDLERDAHLYRQYNGKKCVLTLDPRWLATSTAFVNFKSGRVEVAGFGLITAIDDRQMMITPYILGVPQTPYDIKQFQEMGCSNRNQQRQPVKGTEE